MTHEEEREKEKEKNLVGSRTVCAQSKQMAKREGTANAMRQELTTRLPLKLEEHAALTLVGPSIQWID